MMKILVADDDAAIRQSIQLILMDHPYELSECGDLDLLHSRLLSQPPDLLLLDVHFKERTSLDLLRKLAADGFQIPTVILSGAASAGEAAEAIKLGAYDFIEKPASADRLRMTIRRCLENEELKLRLNGMTPASSLTPTLLGASPETEKLRRAIEQYAGKDVRVLITGETGTGKEVVAQVYGAARRAPIARF